MIGKCLNISATGTRGGFPLTWHHTVVEGALLNTEHHLRHLAEPLVSHADGDLGGQDGGLVLLGESVADSDSAHVGEAVLVLLGQREHVNGSLALGDGVIAGVAAEEGGDTGLLAGLDGLDVQLGLAGVSGRELEETLGVCYLQLVLI